MAMSTELLQVRLRPETKLRLAELARRNSRTMTGEVERMIEDSYRRRVSKQSDEEAPRHRP